MMSISDSIHDQVLSELLAPTDFKQIVGPSGSAPDGHPQHPTWPHASAVLRIHQYRGGGALRPAQKAYRFGLLDWISSTRKASTGKTYVCWLVLG